MLYFGSAFLFYLYIRNNIVLQGAQQTEQLTRRELEFTKERLVECETTMNKLQKQDRDRGTLLQSLKQEKAAIQVCVCLLYIQFAEIILVEVCIITVVSVPF